MSVKSTHNMVYAAVNKVQSDCSLSSYDNQAQNMLAKTLLLTCP